MTVIILASAIATVGAADATRTLVVGLGQDAADPARLKAQAAAESNEGRAVLDPAAVLASVWGARSPASFQNHAILSKLEEARTKEADFDTAGANELRRQVIVAFEQALRPDAEARGLAALALQEMVAAAFAEGQQAEAEGLAQELGRRFPEPAPDPRRFPPKVIELIKENRDRVNDGAKGKVTINGEGEVWLDGRSLGQSRGKVVRTVPVGSYRAWLVNGSDVSLPKTVEVSENAETTVTIDPVLDRCLRLLPAMHLTCPEGWSRDLNTLAQLTGAERVVGVLPPGAAAVPGSQNGLLVIDLTADEATAITQQNIAMVEAPPPAFSPLYLIPFGGGQFAQGRPVFGSIYLTVVTGLGVWFAVATAQHAEVNSSGLVESEPEYRLYRNLSAGLFFGALGATVIEAIIYGLLAGE